MNKLRSFVGKLSKPRQLLLLVFTIEFAWLLVLDASSLFQIVNDHSAPGSDTMPWYWSYFWVLPNYRTTLFWVTVTFAWVLMSLTRNLHRQTYSRPVAAFVWRAIMNIPVLLLLLIGMPWNVENITRILQSPYDLENLLFALAIPASLLFF